MTFKVLKLPTTLTDENIENLNELDKLVEEWLALPN